MATSGYVPNIHHPEIMRSILAGIVETGDVIGAASPVRSVACSKTETAARVLLQARPPRTGPARTEGNRVPV